MKLPTNVRWRIVALLFAATTINYIDRNVLSFMMIDDSFRKEMLGLTPSAQLSKTDIDAFKIQMGYIDSMFKFTYAFGFILMGWFIDKVGTKHGFGIGIFLWSIAASLHAFVGSLVGLKWLRAFLGLGEAANFPASIKTLSEWFPRNERGLAAGVFNAGANVGVIITALAIPYITLHYGWRAAFLITGSGGFIVLIAWVLFYKNIGQHPNISVEEKTYIQANINDKEESVSFTWIQLLSKRQTWAFAIGKFMADPIWWFYLTWLPDFFNSNEALDQKLNLKTIGLPFLIIYIISDLGSVFFGWLSTYFLKIGWSLNRARKTTLLLCACCVLPISFAATTHNIYIAVALISLATAAHTGWAANMYTFASDLFPKSAVASVTGIGGMMGSLGGVLFAAAAGIIKVKYGYLPLFIIASTSYIIGFLLIHWVLPILKPIK
jgi:MFS transporter, ACS family, hexuronate transporter